MTEDAALITVAAVTGIYGAYVFFNTWSYCRSKGEAPLRTSLKWGLGAFALSFLILSSFTVIFYGHSVADEDDPAYRSIPRRR